MKIRRKRELYRLPDLTAPFKDVVFEQGDNLHIGYAQNVGDIYRHNYELQKNSDENWAKSKEMKHAAAIPILEWVKLEKEGITKHPQALLRVIEMHPEWKVTRKQLA